MSNQEETKGKIFEDISAEQQENGITEIESLCMQCHQNGTTRLLLTRIPHFREIILMAFECPHCQYKNNEIQTAASIQDNGVTYSCKIQNKQDLNRQVVKSENATLKFEEINLEVPQATQRGTLNTVEGFLMKAMEDLQQDQPLRKVEQPEVFEKIEQLIEQVQKYLEEPNFTVILDDPSGNSYIENLNAPNKDPKMKIKTYKRTAEQSIAIGLDPEHDHSFAEEPLKQITEEVEEEKEAENLKDEVFVFPANCSNCQAPSQTKMKLIDIPYFKEVIIMSTTCEECGYKSNEVKSSGAISEKGKKIILKITNEEDLSRDILKSESCGLTIPEIDLVLEPGTLGGKFTTIEGLLDNIYDELSSRRPFLQGDSSQQDHKERMKMFLEKLEGLKNGKKEFTIVLEDPLGNSYVQNLFAPDPDPNMEVVLYDRTWEQNEFLGLNDIKTE